MSEFIIGFPSWCGDHHPCHDHIMHALSEVLTRLDRIEKNEEKIMSDQATEASVAAQIETDVQAINAGVANVQAEITQLQQANPALDWSAVNQALTDLGSAASGVTAAGAEVPPATPPAPAS